MKMMSRGCPCRGWLAGGAGGPFFPLFSRAARMLVRCGSPGVFSFAFLGLLCFSPASRLPGAGGALLPINELHQSSSS